MRSHARQVHPPSVDLDEEEHVEPAQEDGVDAEEVRGQDALGLGPVGAENLIRGR
jgi:hypothetical protein